MKNNQTVISAMIRTCKASLSGFNRYTPKPLEVIFNTALKRACEALPVVRPEYLKLEILYRIINYKLIAPSEIEEADEMINQLKMKII